MYLYAEVFYQIYFLNLQHNKDITIISGVEIVVFKPFGRAAIQIE